MRRPLTFSVAVRAFTLVCLASLAVLSTACAPSGRKARESLATEWEARIRHLSDASLTSDERVVRILEEAKRRDGASLLALIHVMRDRSQAAFHLAPDASATLGYRALETKDGEEGRDPLERVAAIVALGNTGTPYQALPDLLLALDDREPLVANHAAHLLVKLGNRAGIPVLLKNLKGKILACESAAEILRTLSAGAVVLIPDSGHAAKAESIEQAQAWWSKFQTSGALLVGEGRPYQKGQDAEADRRIQFYVDVLGQFQFLYHEQARRVFMRMGIPGLPFLREGIDVSRQAGNETLRGGIAQVLAEIDARNSRDLLKDLLKDDRVAVRLRAALALGALKGEDSVAALKGALSDPDASVIVGVLRGLGRTQSDQAVQILSAMDPKDDPDLKRARVLGLFEASRGVRERSVVLSMLSAPALNDRNQAHEALVALTGERFDYDPLKGEEHGKAVADRYLEWWKTRP